MTAILVIDDDESYRDLIRYILENNGHKVFEANDGKRGKKMIEEVNPDVVITDIFMPEKDGLETILETKKMDSKIKILAISGSIVLDKQQYLEFAKTFGSDACLGKPFLASELIQTVDEILQLN